tara:strand:+ start:171 stop:1142 length:972 start_codon:yes stop_codon:yes gene_type:complete
MAKITLNVGSNANDGTGDTLRSAMQNVNTMFTELYESPLFSGAITVSGNNISANRSNDDLVLAPSGTGTVTAPKIVIDENISITDNEITTTQSNSDLVLSASGTGSVVIANADINGGAIDGTVIGANSAVAGTFTTLTVNSSMAIDGVTIADNTVSTNASNANLELSGNGSGTVSLSGLKFPTSDGSSGQFLKTDGSGQLGFATASATLNHSDINDNTTTVATSATTQIDSFSSATYRSAKYFISIADATNSRFEMVEANVIHGPSADSTIEAYLTVFGSTTSYSAPLCTFTADIDDGNVRLMATNITSDSTVFKFQRTLIDL